MLKGVKWMLELSSFYFFYSSKCKIYELLTHDVELESSVIEVWFGA